MKFHYDLSGCQQIIKDIPIYGAGSGLLEGATIMKGATAGTDQGFGVIATAASLASVLGVLAEVHADPGAAGDDSKQDGTVITYRKVLINPFAVFLAENYPGSLAIDAASATTNVVITNLEDNIDGGWILGSDGMLQYLTASAAGSATTKSAHGWDAADTATKILPLFHALLTLKTTAEKLQNAAAVGTGKARVIENYIQAAGVPRQKLDPTKHSGITYTDCKIFTDILFTDHAFGING